MRNSKCAARRGLGIACLALGLASAPGRASADDAPPPAHRVTITAGEIPDALAAARAGLVARTRQRFQAASVSTLEPAAERPGAGAPGSCARAAAAAPEGATELVLVDLRAAKVGFDLALRVYAPEGCRLAQAARAHGDATQLGVALDTALVRLLPTLEGDGSALGPAPAMSLEQLAAESRALAAVAEQELARAWRELDGDESPVARELRGRVEARAAEPDFSAAERLRLRVARGDEISSELATKKLLTEAARELDLPDRPMDARLALAAGEIRLSRGEADDARKYLEHAVGLLPKNPDAQLALGRALALAGDDAGAQRAFQHAAELEPESGQALEQLAQLQAHDPARSAALLATAGERAARGLELREALSDYTRAARLDSGATTSAHEKLAGIHASLADPEHARASWREAIKSGGPTPARLLGAAIASRALGDSADAEGVLRHALELEPSGHAATRELGAVILEAGRADEARPLLERAVTQDAGDLDAKLALARLHAGAGEGQAGLALLDAVELGRGTSARHLELRAEILAKSGDLAGSRAALSRAVELDPIDPALRLALADRAEALGDSQAAALEREHAALLAEEPADELARAPGDSTPDFAGVDPNLVKLALSFGPVPSEAGRVIFVGVRESLGWKDEILDFLRPEVPNLDKMERGLRRVLESQAALMSRADLDKALANVATAGTLAELYRFETDRSLDASAAVDLNLALGGDALFLGRLERRSAASAGTSLFCGPEAPWRLELRQLAGRSAPRARILGNAACLSPVADEYLTWNPRAAALYGTIALLALLMVLRGWGSISVVVELPPETRALFSISVSRRARKTAKTEGSRTREKQKWRIEDRLRRLNRFERPLREGAPTSFRWIPARRRAYYVTVRGPLHNSATGELIGDFLEEQLVRVKRGAKVTAKFDMRPKEAALEILVSGAPKGTSHVAIALRGDPRSLRYVSDGPVFLYVKPGRHVMLVGAGERLLERVVEVRSCDSMRIMFDVARETGALFSGSAEAVSAYLEGDVARAADALERAGQTQAASKLRADLMRAKGDVTGASRALETAGDLRGAAELRATAKDSAGAAALFEAAEDFDKAGDAYRAAGDFAAAARAYERAGSFGEAVACAKEADDPERLLALYEKNASHFEAGELAATLKQTARAIHNLARVEVSESNYTGACRRLIELYIERGQLPNALSRLDALLEAQGSESDSTLPLCAVKAELLEKLNRAPEALEVWESIEARAPKFRGAAERAAALRAKQAPAPAEAPAPAQAESRYEIQEELGRGAMGVVYKARDTHLGRIVALKRLTENLRGHPTAIAFFEREARAAAALNHSNIVTVYDAGNEAGHYFITMEFLQGTTLDTILRARGAMAGPVAAAIGMQVCTGLQYAHTARIIHRDVKTANLFYTRERIVKIMDFGLAKMVEEVRKGATVIGGTPFYMAPEQAAGENVDHRADLYALGVTLFELLTKSVPFRQGDVTFHHRSTPAPDPRERVASIPAGLAEIVVKLMQKSPDARYQSAAEVGAALQPFATQV